MKKAILFIVFFFAVALADHLLPVYGTTGGKIHYMVGEIIAIELPHSTVVIEVPLEKGLFTVAGPLSDGAVLKRSGASADLTDFVSGDEVIVKWRATGQGHLIDAIIGK